MSISNSCVFQGQNVQLMTIASLSGSERWRVLDAVKRAEKRTFPRKEAMDFDTELKRRNTHLYCAVIDLKNEVQLVAYIVCACLKKVTFLHKVCVLEQYRRHGIAKWMICKLQDDLGGQGCESIKLWVDEDREPACLLYASCGFEQVGRVEDYYAPGRAALSMVSALDDNP
ncbi:acetyltransferas-like protein [Xylona heveae TC161]|uniref:Acetyltransferas-like protein n=1 Tax=Xylona heveae (strain CBS 132557 / TC161) TaxID=1328760 RepID=A0A165IZ18_XYLHT|nr:acetyltransferas-like protein [Xylona heveae TC161]KZF25570.1 acetyltransferas-like protein [Xylona heveae TC161]